MESTDQSSRIGFGRRLQALFFKTGEEETIDFIFTPLPLRRRQSGTHGSFVGPVTFVFRAFLDPAFQERFLLFCQDKMRLRRWHELVGIVGNDAPPGFAFL